MPEARGTVPGQHNQHRTMLYALSTCIWCRRTRQFLEDEGVAFDFVYVDLLEGEERAEAMAEVRRWNPRGSMPTVVVDDKEYIVGFKPDMIKEVLGL